MTHTEQLRRALRAYDIAGPETPERAAALAAVLSAAHNLCAAPTTRHRIVMPERAVCDTYTPVDIGSKNFKAGFNFGLSEIDRLNQEPEQPLSDKECAAVQMQEGVTGCDVDCGCPYQKARDAKKQTEQALEDWPGSPAPELPTPLQIEVANLRRQLRDTQDDLQRARYSPAEHWT